MALQGRIRIPASKGVIGGRRLATRWMDLSRISEELLTPACRVSAFECNLRPICCVTKSTTLEIVSRPRASSITRMQPRMRLLFLRRPGEVGYFVLGASPPSRAQSKAPWSFAHSPFGSVFAFQKCRRITVDSRSEPTVQSSVWVLCCAPGTLLWLGATILGES